MAVEYDIGQRNSGYRKISEPLLNPVVKVIEWVDPEIEAIDIGRAGAKITKWGIRLKEHMNRHNISSKELTMLAGGLVIAGLACDLVDGKWARYKRSKLTDENLKRQLEAKGQADDPAIDADLEAFQSEEAGETASHFGSRWGVLATAFSKGTNNFARTVKSVVGMFGVPVPEAYKPWDILRFPGASLGRKLLYVGTFKPRIDLAPGLSIPVQEIVHTWVSISNLVVTAERAGALLKPPNGYRLSDKEVEFAGVRTERLLPISVLNIVSAINMGSRLNPKS